MLEEAIMRLMNIAQDQSTMLMNHQKILEEQTAILRTLTENVDELRRDARHTQRIWTRLAQKNGWLDDEDLWDDQDAAP